VSERVVTPEQTRTEMTWIVMPSQTNALGTVFGGQIMAWVDVCAAVSAQRFVRGHVVTAEMDQLSFRAPIRQGDVVVLRAQVNWAGRTSMEVGVRVDGEDPITGRRWQTSTAYLTFVAVDADGKPRPAGRLVPQTDDERRRWREAELRRDNRIKARKELCALRAEQ
jgi:acyl-CoA hydrolase